jgi:predicted dehydrogenase
LFNLAIIGLGSWGERLVESVQGKSDIVRFTHAVSRDPSRLADFSTTHGIATSDDYDAVLSDPAVDGVVVSGAGHLHAPQGIEAATAGKHVLVIKPFANYRKDAEALRDAARKSGVLAALGYDRCFSPAVHALRERVGTLGKIIHAEGNFCVDRYRGYTAGDWKTSLESNPPGSLADHMLYTMIELVGPVAHLSAQGMSQVVTEDFVDSSTVMMRFSSGASGSLTAIGVTPIFHRLHLFGSEGWAEIRGNTWLEVHTRQGKPEILNLAPTDMLKAELETFAAAASGTAKWPVSMEVAIAGVAALEAMRDSARSGKPVVM